MNKFKIRGYKMEKSVFDMNEEEFILNYYDMVISEIIKTGNINNIEDLAQDCIIKLLKLKDKLKRDKNKHQINSFIAKAIKNTIKDKLKSPKNIYYDICFEGYEADKQEELFGKEDFYMLSEKLSEDELNILKLYNSLDKYGNKINQQDIAELLDVSQQVISYKLKKIKQKLGG